MLRLWQRVAASKQVRGVRLKHRNGIDLLVDRRMNEADREHLLKSLVPLPICECALLRLHSGGAYPDKDKSL